jgi:glycosyltransferase involved in cell wall biosynthesis
LAVVLEPAPRLERSETLEAVEATTRLIPSVSVIMPAFNEEGNIAQCVGNVSASLERMGNPFEIIVIDDGSTDNTRAEALGARNNPHVKVVGYGQNRGKGFAIKHGVKYATGDVVVFRDSDADVMPGLVGRYVSMLRDCDIAIASKRHPDSQVKAPLLRKLLSYSFHTLVMLLTGVRVSDTQSGLKAFRREALEKIMGLISVKHYAYDVEILTVARLLKMRIVELPVNIELGGLFSVRSIVRMLVDLVGITYRLRVIRWYQRNLHNSRANYKPIVKW